MATLFDPGGGLPVNLSTAQSGNAVSTNVAQRRFDTVPRGSMMRIIAATGTACTYLIEGSADNSTFWPVPSGDVAPAAPGPFSLVAGTFTVSAAGTLWRLIPVDQPWTFLRVTYSANTAMVNTTDLFIY